MKLLAVKLRIIEHEACFIAISQHTAGKAGMIKSVFHVGRCVVIGIHTYSHRYFMLAQKRVYFYRIPPKSGEVCGAFP